ncbi:MAG: ATP-binding protein [Candidatus Hodarchaeota archaeon]
MREIIKIDEEKCNGCGLCVPACLEGALQIINGKARLIREIYCDGLGACIGECPQGAINIEERMAEKFDEEMVKKHLKEKELQAQVHAPTQRMSTEISPLVNLTSELTQWPIQLKLIPPKAPYFQDVNLVIVADCVPFAYANFHQDFLKGKSIVIGCPKLDDAQFYEKKLTELFLQSKIRSVTIVNMEVPCCHGLYHITKNAIQRSGKDMPMKQIIISIKGERKQ